MINLFLRILYTTMTVYFQAVVRLDAAASTARTDWAELKTQVMAWAKPNPRSSWTYQSRHSARRLRAVVQEADIRRMQRGFEHAASALTGEIRRIAA